MSVPFYQLIHRLKTTGLLDFVHKHDIHKFKTVYTSPDTQQIVLVNYPELTDQDTLVESERQIHPSVLDTEIAKILQDYTPVL